MPDAEKLPTPQPTTYVDPKSGLVDTPAFAEDYWTQKSELLDDMFGPQAGQAERKAAFDRAMGQAVRDGAKNAAVYYAQRQARALIDACRGADQSAFQEAWKTVNGMDGAFNVAIQLAMMVVQIREPVGTELETGSDGRKGTLTTVDVAR